MEKVVKNSNSFDLSQVLIPTKLISRTSSSTIAAASILTISTAATPSKASNFSNDLDIVTITQLIH